MANPLLPESFGKLSLFNVQLSLIGKKGYNPSGPFFKGEVKCEDFDNNL
jgi:hypothetical protein